MEDRKDLKKIVDTLRTEFSEQVSHHDSFSNQPSITSHTPPMSTSSGYSHLPPEIELPHHQNQTHHEEENLPDHSK
jgi:hypothetical protein